MAGSLSSGLGFLLLFALAARTVEQDVVDEEQFLVFGHVDIQPRNYSRDACALHLSVQISSHIWKSAITSDFYVFKAPLNQFLRLPGVIDVQVSKGLQEFTLWRRAFVVDDTGGYHADAALTLPMSLNCSSQTDEQKTDDNAGSLVPVPSPTFQSLEVCSTSVAHMCPIANTNTSDMVVNPLAIYEEPEVKEESSQPFFPLISHQRLLWLVVSGLIIHLHIRLLSGFPPSQVPTSHNPVSEEHPGAAWEFWKRKNGHHKTVIASGTGCFNKAWRDAQDLLLSSDGGCFCYNCCSPSRKCKQSAKWNRDAFGRLTR